MAVAPGSQRTILYTFTGNITILVYEESIKNIKSKECCVFIIIETADCLQRPKIFSTLGW